MIKTKEKTMKKLFILYMQFEGDVNLIGAYRDEKAAQENLELHKFSLEGDDLFSEEMYRIDEVDFSD